MARPPVVVALGRMGVGKSSFLNALTSSKQFPSGDGLDPVTARTSIEHGCWFGNQRDSLVVIDTPGLGDLDSATEDSQILDMVRTVKGHGYVSAFVVVLPYSTTRFTKGTLKMLRFFEATFGEGFWSRVVVTFSSTLRHLDPQRTPEKIQEKMWQWQDAIKKQAGVELCNAQFYFVDSLSLFEEPDNAADIANKEAFQALRLHVVTSAPVDVSCAVVVSGGEDFQHALEMARVQRELEQQQQEAQQKIEAEQRAREEAAAAAAAAAAEAAKQQVAERERIERADRARREEEETRQQLLREEQARQNETKRQEDEQRHRDEVARIQAQHRAAVIAAQNANNDDDDGCVIS